MESNDTPRADLIERVAKRAVREVLREPEAVDKQVEFVAWAAAVLAASELFGITLGCFENADDVVEMARDELALLEERAA